MLIGVPKEIKSQEYRVGLTPASVRELTSHGHQIMVEHGAGAGINTADSAYQAAGASIVSSAEEVFARADMIVKVKEPQADRVQAPAGLGRSCSPTCHLAPDPEQTTGSARSGAICIAYETVTDARRRTAPARSHVRSRRAHVDPGRRAQCLEKTTRRNAASCSAAWPGCRRPRSSSSAAGVVGSNAAQMAVGSGAQLVVLDRRYRRAAAHGSPASARARSRCSPTATTSSSHVLSADLVIGGVLIPGAAAPKLVSRQMVSAMKPGIGGGGRRHRPGRLFRDQSHPTTHAEPTYRRRPA